VISIPFNWPYLTGRELHYIEEARSNGHLAGDGPFPDHIEQLELIAVGPHHHRHVVVGARPDDLERHVRLGPAVHADFKFDRII